MHRPRILVADDDRAVRRALKVQLSVFGYDVIESADGLGVLRQTLPCNVAGVILDYDMPNGDGRSIARMIRKECDAPIIFISGYDREDFRPIVSQLADVYFLPKPLDMDKLHDLLSSLAPTSEKELIGLS